MVKLVLKRIIKVLNFAIELSDVFTVIKLGVGNIQSGA